MKFVFFACPVFVDLIGIRSLLHADERRSDNIGSLSNAFPDEVRKPIYLHQNADLR